MPEAPRHQPDDIDIPGVLTWSGLAAGAIALVLTGVYFALGRQPEQALPAPERAWAERPAPPPPRLSTEPAQLLAELAAREEAWLEARDIDAAMAATARRGWRSGVRYPARERSGIPAPPRAGDEPPQDEEER